jgi:SAUR family protein
MDPHQRKIQNTQPTMRELMRRFSFSDRVSDGGGVPRGCVPVLVCDGEGEGERFVVRVEALRHPSFAALLEMAAQEFGYKQEGVLRVPCAVHHFRDVLSAVSVSSPRT